MMNTHLRPLIRHKAFPLLPLALGVGIAHFGLSRLGALLMATGFIVMAARGPLSHCIRLGRAVAQQVTAIWRRPRQRPASPTSTSPAVELAWYILYLVALVAFFVPLITGSSRLQWALMQGVVVGVAILGANEWRLRIQHLIERSWTYAVGKFALAALAGVFLSVATSQARQFTYTLTNEDPSAFPTFVSLVALCMLPLMYFSTVCMLAVLWSFMESLGVGALICLRAVDRKFRGFFSGRSGGVFASANENSFVSPEPDYLRIVRPASMLILVLLLLINAPDVDPKKHSAIRTFAMIVLTRMDYWPQRVCGQSSVLNAAKLETGRYSVAMPLGHRVELKTITCPREGHVGN